MEFEHDTPATARDITLANTQHASVQPLNDVHPDLSSAPGAIDTSTRRTFEFEKESTQAAASASQDSHHGHRVALICGVVIAVLFGGMLMTLLALR